MRLQNLSRLAGYIGRLPPPPGGGGRVGPGSEFPHRGPGVLANIHSSGHGHSNSQNEDHSNHLPPPGGHSLNTYRTGNDPIRIGPSLQTIAQEADENMPNREDFAKTVADVPSFADVLASLPAPHEMAEKASDVHQKASEVHQAVDPALTLADTAANVPAVGNRFPRVASAVGKASTMSTAVGALLDGSDTIISGPNRHNVISLANNAFNLATPPPLHVANTVRNTYDAVATLTGHGDYTSTAMLASGVDAIEAHPEQAEKFNSRVADTMGATDQDMSRDDLS